MKPYLLIALSVIITSCNPKKEPYQTISDSKLTAVVAEEGKKMMETHCYVCHSPNAPEGTGRIAPPMVAIKARYIDREGYDKNEFIASVQSFVENPTEEKALMFGAVRKHGLMPKQVFPDGVIEKIAAFMYDYQIEEPEWFQSHWQGNGNSNWSQSGKIWNGKEQSKTTADVGLDYALSTKQVLGKNLMDAIQKKGTVAALEFCNTKAIPLTDSMSAYHKATIKRVSDKNRNPNNKANAEELGYMEQFKSDAVAKIESQPIVIEKGDWVQFYYPIPTNTMCLQCHGKQIKPDVQKQILQLYPNDLAVGYGENEIRGMWSIRYPKK